MICPALFWSTCLALLFLLESPREKRCPYWLPPPPDEDAAAACGMAMSASMSSAGATAVAARSFCGGCNVVQLQLVQVDSGGQQLHFVDLELDMPQCSERPKGYFSVSAETVRPKEVFRPNRLFFRPL